jgi:hypothetical protein
MLEIVCATRTLKYGDIIYLTLVLLSIQTIQQDADGTVLAVNCIVHVLVWCVAVNIMFLLTIFKESAGNVLLLLTNTHCI